MVFTGCGTRTKKSNGKISGIEKDAKWRWCGGFWGKEGITKTERGWWIWRRKRRLFGYVGYSFSTYIFFLHLGVFIFVAFRIRYIRIYSY
jgi:hypothetical protein